MTEVPDYLLERSRERRAALGLETGGDAGESSVVPAASTEAAPAAAAAPAPAAAPEIEPVQVPEPVPPWVEAAETRKKIPVWMAPVAVFLPIWGFMIWGTLEEPTREAEGPLAAGAEIYSAQCSSCHGAGGGGGVGYQLNDGEVVATFPTVEGHIAWVVNGTENTGPSYGSANRPGGQRGTGAQGVMPSFAALSSTEVLEVVLYERNAHGLVSEETLEPYLLWAESGELPSWGTGVSPQEISAQFTEFAETNAEVSELVEELAAEGE